MKTTKGYPRTQFTIENYTSIASIDTVQPDSKVIPIFMGFYTSDRGVEDWELITTFDKFTDKKGPLSFNRHGQAQLTIANALANGAYYYAKRLVSPDATLANATVKARVLVVNDVSYVYLYSVSAEDVKTLQEAIEAGYGEFNATADPEEVTVGDDSSSAKSYDIPLFTVAGIGRGASSVQFIIRPEYNASKSSNFAKYSFEISENSNILENIMVTLNPDVIIDGVNQSIKNKLNKNSSQFNAEIYEDGFGLLANVLSETMTIKVKGQDDPVPVIVEDLVNMDFINGCTKTGNFDVVGGVVTAAVASIDSEQKTLWDSFKPEDITTLYSFDRSSEELIPLAGGSYGTMGANPINNMDEYEKLILGALGRAEEDSEYADLFDPAIFNVDMYKIDAIFDCAYPISIKNAIIDLVDWRGDLAFFADLGTECSDINLAVSTVEKITQSKYCAVYGNYFNIEDPFTKKDITVTMPYLLSTKLIDHIVNGVGRPFAGINNRLYFPEINIRSINFIPVEIPGVNQKQQLVDSNINYLALYDSVPVMETLYVNDDAYTQLSFLHNILAIQEVIKAVRTECPRIRYTFLDGGNDLQNYIDDVTRVINQYSTNFKSISVEYAKDEMYESNNIFYAIITVQFFNFVQEEKFKIIAI